MSTIKRRILMISLVFFTTLSRLGVALLNLECKPRPAVVTTSSRPVFDYYPYFVHLHRCSGSKGKTSPQLVRCVADRVEKFRIEAKLSTSFKKVEVEVVNHTSCKNECVMKRNECRPPARFDPQSCKCICDLGVLGPYGKICRDTRKMWKDQHCGCWCKNTRKCENRRKYFDQETCSCRCKRRKRSKRSCSYYGRDYDPLTCSCYQKSRTAERAKEKNNTIYWLAAVVAEFIIMVCAFKFFLYTKGSGIIFSAKKNVAASEMNKDKRDDEKSDRMTYREILRRQSRVSSSVRKRSSRLSSVTPVTPTTLKSPNYNNGEDVFFNE